MQSKERSLMHAERKERFDADLWSHTGYLEEKFVNDLGEITYCYTPLFSTQEHPEKFYIRFHENNPLNIGDGEICTGVQDHAHEWVCLRSVDIHTEVRSRFYHHPDEERTYSTRVFSDSRDVEALDVLLQEQFEKRDSLWEVRPPLNFTWTGEWCYEGRVYFQGEGKSRLLADGGID